MREAVEGGAARTAAALRRWFEHQRRDLPWRRTRDPYAIWVSEIMLQQTRVETVIPYYRRFLEAFPTVEALATAAPDDVLKRWEGLGYYARARNLQRAAQAVRANGSGVPRTRDGLLTLPGIGRYTAGAIASIAYGERVAAVDGNVERVLSRLHAIERGSVWPQAEALVAVAADPSTHNQALMELGATLCTPRTPRCDACPIGDACAGRKSGDPTRFPEKVRTKVLPRRDMAAALLWHGERFLVVKRPTDGLLGGLWDLPSAERTGRESRASACARALAPWGGETVEVGLHVATVRHVFTHFRMDLHVHECRTATPTPTDDRTSRWITPAERSRHAFPKATNRVFETLLD